MTDVAPPVDRQASPGFPLSRRRQASAPGRLSLLHLFDDGIGAVETRKQKDAACVMNANREPDGPMGNGTNGYGREGLGITNGFELKKKRRGDDSRSTAYEAGRCDSGMGMDATPRENWLSNGNGDGERETMEMKERKMESDSRIDVNTRDNMDEDESLIWPGVLEQDKGSSTASGRVSRNEPRNGHPMAQRKQSKGECDNIPNRATTPSAGHVASQGGDAGGTADTSADERTAVQMEGSAAEDPTSKHTMRDTSPCPRPRKDKTLKLSPAQIHELTSSPESLCLRTLPPEQGHGPAITDIVEGTPAAWKEDGSGDSNMALKGANGLTPKRDGSIRKRKANGKHVHLEGSPELIGSSSQNRLSPVRQRSQTRRMVSTPGTSHKRQASIGTERRTQNRTLKSRPDRRVLNGAAIEHSGRDGQIAQSIEPATSPMPVSIPLPPFSIPTYLQLELSSDRPSPLYIHQPRANDFPYESSRVKLERLQNFFLLPPSLEQVLFFGTLACLDAWLYSFTILPLRFCKSILILLQSWIINLGVEAQFISSFIVKGLGRVWRRRRSAPNEPARQDIAAGKETSRTKETPTIHSPVDDPFADDGSNVAGDRLHRGRTTRRHRRVKSIPSTLRPDDKADILKGLLMIFTCIVLMRFDASRMYHWIRGQAAIKLYVIYNVLEVGDRLFSAIGQDVLECLFSQEALERRPDGRSKVIRPFWLFLLALVYTVIHSTALFYQVMTLNVAVNSYSNALITLLLSNQFVEIKSTVFKKFEKENLFQITCADVVERFQLWLMLMIIASRNFVETGAITFGNALAPFSQHTPTPSTNSTPLANPPRSTSSILPQSFTMLPSSVFASLSSVNSFLPTLGHIMGPFLVVLGSEMLVDWLKHAYINKFNNTRPSIYGRFLDILTKDYYTNAFADQNLTRRLGLPIIPLSCIFFRVSVQTYQMFLTAWLPHPPSPFVHPSNATSLSSIHNHYPPTAPAAPTILPTSFPLPTSLAQINSIIQTVISHATPSPTAFIPIFTVILILLLYLTLLLLKIILGMILLSYSRARYKRMKQQQQQQAQKSTADGDTVEGSRRVGGWGSVEVGEERRRWIYADDPEGAKKLREREERDKASKAAGGGGDGKNGLHGIENVRRYDMVAKRIW